MKGDDIAPLLTFILNSYSYFVFHILEEVLAVVDQHVGEPLVAFQLAANAEAAGIVVALAPSTSSHPVSAEYAASGGAQRASANHAGAFE